MIAVIADDLTGAAEIGGIGLSYNFKVEIAHEVNLHSTADMLVINTDARSKKEQEAVEITGRVSRQLKALNPQFLFKKIDSVMRGHVVAEIAAQCNAMEISRALVVPANPALGRTLVNGHYYINQVPAHETSFRHDPEFPVTHSHVLKRFEHADEVIFVQPHTATLPLEGVIIGEVETGEDLDEWAQHLKNDTLAVGASGFFRACLNKLYPNSYPNKGQHPALNNPILYISGSTFKQSAALINSLQSNSGPVSYMSAGLMQQANNNENLLSNWVNEIIALLQTQGKAVIAIPQDEQPDIKHEAKYLRKQMALAVKAIFETVPVAEMVIEGGSTAAAILEEMDIRSIFPVQELSPGVIRSVVKAPYPGLHITMKPGSYSWSSEVWPF
jgi:uncharacterized protein YgbK (DUF1537 family)